MIYELRTSRVTPGAVPEFEAQLGRAIGSRRGGRLAGCWHTEIGPLLQVVELWVHDSGASYARAASQPWPPSGGDLLQSLEIELLEPAPFMRPLDGQPRTLGPFYELRIYQTRSGQVTDMIEKWGPMLPGREKLSPLAGCWYSDAGRWFHLWPYPDLAVRSRTRADAQQRGIWPPPTTEHLLTLENKIMLPTSFSPLQ